MFRPLLRALVLVASALAAACGSSVDLKDALEVTDTSGGWYDAGIVDGKNKLVPGVTFRLRKRADVNLERVSLNVVFRHAAPSQGAAEEDWDEVFLQNVTFAEGQQTAPVPVRTDKGYTADPPQTRADILKHSGFRDVHARIYAKHSSTQWVDLGAIDVQRQLIVR